MKLSTSEKKKARIEIIPMIDTMFFLLVFFMISTLSMTLQKGMEVNLPKASSASDDLPEQVTLTIGSKGELFFNRTPARSRNSSCAHTISCIMGKNPRW